MKPLPGCVEVSAEFICAMVAFGDKEFREADKPKPTHPWRANQPGQMQGHKPKPAKAPGRMAP